ncbi:hypothetical protein M3J09_011839 [Ascochyta lentis]
MVSCANADCVSRIHEATSGSSFLSSVRGVTGTNCCALTYRSGTSRTYISVLSVATADSDPIFRQATGLSHCSSSQATLFGAAPKAARAFGLSCGSAAWRLLYTGLE